MLVRKHLKNLKGYKPGKPISEVKRELGLEQVIKLASNENPFPPSSRVQKAISDSLKEINRYPDANCFLLRRELAKRLKISPDNLIFGNGSDELIVLAFRAFVEEDEEIVVGEPSFLIYQSQAEAFKIKVKKSHLKNFRYDLKDMRRLITKKTKLIFIANPDNPNGTYLSEQEVDDFLKSLPEHVVVFFDEAYAEFAPRDFPKTLNFLKKGYNIIVTRTFSKAYSLAGLRIGFGVSNKDFIEAMNKVREPFNVNSLAQIAAVEALKDKSYLKQSLSYIRKEKEFLYSGLQTLKFNFVKSYTNFILVSTGGTDSKKVFNDLLKRGVIVRDMSGWGLKNYIRVTVGKHNQNNKFLKELSFICKDIRR